MSDEALRQAAEVHYFRALEFFANGQHAEAISQYRESIAIDPTFTDAMHGLTRAHQDLDQLDEAIAVATRIAEIDPEDILAHTSLSILQQKKGNVPEAEAEANKARVLGWKQQLQEKKNLGGQVG